MTSNGKSFKSLISVQAITRCKYADERNEFTPVVIDRVEILSNYSGGLAGSTEYKCEYLIEKKTSDENDQLKVA